MSDSTEAPPLAGLLLAAGGSTRFGSPKALATFRGVPLVRRAAELLLGACPSGVRVVTGAADQAIRRILAPGSVEFTHNPAWQTGLSSSLACGIESMRPGPEAVLVMFCDLPAVTGADLQRIVAAWAARPGCVAAAEFAGRLGPPVIFPRSTWPTLLLLRGDRGARGLIRSAGARIGVPMPAAALDVDTPEELARLEASLP